ncbi:MAG: DMT family transporter [Prolixibacteraceae bacterium]|nr:DMT family transporter [Prolixibacteraceae bacterium]
MLNNLSSISKNQRAVIYALITVLFWSTVATAFKIGLRSLYPAQLIFVGSIVTVIILAGIIVSTNKRTLLKQLKPKDYLYLALLGALNPFLYYIVLFEAYSLLPAQVAQPLNMVWPIVLVLLSVPLLKQKIGWKSFAALFISFAGVVLIASQGKAFTLHNSDNTGIALALGSSVIWSLYWIFSIRNKNDQLITLLVSFSFGTLFLLVYILITGQIHFEWGTSMIAAIYIGVFEIGISFILWMKALSLTSNSARVANLVYIAPFLSLFFIHSILGEKIHLTTIIGIIFIVSGILFQQTDKKRKIKKR